MRKRRISQPGIPSTGDVCSNSRVTSALMVLSIPRRLRKIDVERIDIPPACVADEHLRAVGRGVAPATQRSVELTQILQGEKIFGIRFADLYASNPRFTITFCALHVLHMAAVGRPG